MMGHDAALRVLMVARTFLPDSRGGSEVHAYMLAQHLLSRGHQIAVFHVVFSPGQEEYGLSEVGWQGLGLYRLVRNYSHPLRSPFPFYDRQVEVRFEEVLARFRPDLVHFHILADLSASLPATAHRHGLPSLFTLHDFWPMCFLTHLRTPDGLLCPGPDEGLRCAECLWKQVRAPAQPLSHRRRIRELGLAESLRRAPRFLRDTLAVRLLGGQATYGDAVNRTEMLSLAIRNDYLRRALLRCDRLICPSRFLMGKFVEWGIPESHCLHLCNSVPASLLEERVSHRPTGAQTTFGFVGSLYPPKGVHLLVEAFRHMDPARARLQIWGEVPGPYAQAYADCLRQQGAGVPGLSFEGRFSPEEVGRVLAGLDVLVLPSVWYENNPLVILEAQAAGIPVIAGDIGGMAELVIHDVNGLQFRADDAHDLAEKMQLMLEPERRSRYRDASVPPWTHEQLGSEVERIYRSLLRRGDAVA